MASRFSAGQCRRARAARMTRECRRQLPSALPAVAASIWSLFPRARCVLQLPLHTLISKQQTLCVPAPSPRRLCGGQTVDAGHESRRPASPLPPTPGRPSQRAPLTSTHLTSLASARGSHNRRHRSHSRSSHGSGSHPRVRLSQGVCFPYVTGRALATTHVSAMTSSTSSAPHLHRSIALSNGSLPRAHWHSPVLPWTQTIWPWTSCPGPLPGPTPVDYSPCPLAPSPRRRTTAATLICSLGASYATCSQSAWSASR